MRALIARDLADAAIAALSADRRFANAYNAALQAANMAIGCAGYRVTSKTGHHKIDFLNDALVCPTPLADGVDLSGCDRLDHLQSKEKR
jgi:hypothetical protein